MHRVDLDILWERLRTDPSLSIRYVGTKQQLADILTKGSFTKIVWDELRDLIQTGPGYKKRTEKYIKQSKMTGASAHGAICAEIDKCKSDLAILKHCAKIFQRQDAKSAATKPKRFPYIVLKMTYWIPSPLLHLLHCFVQCHLAQAQ